MRRSILIVLLSMGVIAGYTSAFVGWRFGEGRHYRSHLARICAEAAREAGRGAPSHSDAPGQDQR